MRWSSQSQSPQECDDLDRAVQRPAKPGWSSWTLAVIALVILASGFYFARRSGTDYRKYTNDFNVYYFASREILSGRDPYQQRLGEYMPYLYPPLLAEALIPLALLPLPLSAYLWFIVNAMALVGCAVMSGELIVPRPEKRKEDPTESRGVQDETVVRSATIRRWVVCISVVIVARFAVDCFHMGQVNAVVAALAVAHVYLYEKKRSGWSAVALALAASIKLSPALVVGYHLAKGRVKFAVLCASLMGALCVASFLPFGRQSVPSFRTFWNQTVRNGQGFDLAYAGNQSIRGAVARLEQEGGTAESRITSEPASIVIAVVLIAMAMLSAYRAKTEAQAAAPFLCVAPLLSPLSWKGHFLILLMPVAVVVAVSLLSASSMRRRIAAGTALLAFVGFTLTSSLIVGMNGADWADSRSLILVGALFVYSAVSIFAVDALERPWFTPEGVRRKPIAG